MASRGQRKEKFKAKKAAVKKVPALFSKATLKKGQKEASRLIRKARRLAMHFRMSLSPYKHQYCKHCVVRLIPGNNCRIRINNHKVTYYCLSCKKFRRIPVGKSTGKK